MQPLDRSPFSLTDACTGLLPTCDSVLARRFPRIYLGYQNEDATKKEKDSPEISRKLGKGS